MSTMIFKGWRSTIEQDGNKAIERYSHWSWTGKQETCEYKFIYFEHPNSAANTILFYFIC